MKPAVLMAALAAASAAPATGQAPARIGPPALAESPAPPRERPAVAFSATRQDDGALRRGLVGSVSVAPGVEAGIGLYSVTDDSRRAPETRRTWSPMDVGRRTERVAAVGLKLRF